MRSTVRRTWVHVTCRSEPYNRMTASQCAASTSLQGPGECSVKWKWGKIADHDALRPSICLHCHDESRVSRNEILRNVVTHTCAHRGQRPMVPSPLPLFSFDSRKWEQWTVLLIVAWNFVCDLDTGLIISAWTSEARTKICVVYFYFENYFLFFCSIFAIHIKC